MKPLRRLQEDFQGYLLDLTGPIEDEIIGTETVSVTERLEIYAIAYRLRLLETLETDFVALNAFLGKDKFEEIGRAYIDAHTSDHFSLRYFGRHMSRFLAETPPYRDDPLLAELAAFDWALTDAFDAEDSEVVTADDMAAIPPADWPMMRLVPHASVQRLDLQWNAPAIWKAADQKQETLPTPEKAEFPVSWVVWRQNLESYFRSLTVDEAWALDAVLRGESFATLCEGLCEWIDAQNVAAHAAGLLKQWVTDGLIREITLSEEKRKDTRKK